MEQITLATRWQSKKPCHASKTSKIYFVKCNNIRTNDISKEVTNNRDCNNVIIGGISLVFGLDNSSRNSIKLTMEKYGASNYETQSIQIFKFDLFSFTAFQWWYWFLTQILYSLNTEINTNCTLTSPNTQYCKKS